MLFHISLNFYQQKLSQTRKKKIKNLNKHLIVKGLNYFEFKPTFAEATNLSFKVKVRWASIFSNES